MDTKVCCRCGVEKPINDFRKYYGGRKGRYTYCLSCEKLDFRRKYLVGLLELREELREDQQAELDAINALYDARAAHGLSDPRDHTHSRSIGVMDMVQEEMKRYQ